MFETPSTVVKQNARNFIIKELSQFFTDAYDQNRTVYFYSYH